MTVSRVLDRASIAGLLAGAFCIAAGAMIDGGSLRSLLQGAAALIVFGGTAAAVLVSYPLDELRIAAAGMRAALSTAEESDAALAARATAYAARARRSGVLALEPDVDREPDPFLRKGLAMAVDDVRPQAIRWSLETEMVSLAERDELAPRVLESAGGYAPTMGILGAVLGLINVMQHLESPASVGPGIAVAFVATVYGVGAANLVCLPLASKLRQHARQQERRRAMILEAVLGIRDAVSPRVIEQRLLALRLGREEELRPAPRVRARKAS